MIYVMSDVHGLYDRYRDILGKINLRGDDKLYILGDFVDRGPQGLALLMDAIKKPNIICLRGNHDDTACAILSKVVERSPDIRTSKFAEVMSLWLADGGQATWDEFKRMSDRARCEAVSHLRALPLYRIAEADGQSFFLSHTVPDRARFHKCIGATGIRNACERIICGDDFSFAGEDLLWGVPEYDKKYANELTIVIGHTPTTLITHANEPKVWSGNNHLAIDCGAAFGGKLACVCLNDGKTWYA